MKRYKVSLEYLGEDCEFLNKKEALDYIKNQNLFLPYENANSKIFNADKKAVGYFTIQNLKDYLCLGGPLDGKKCDSVAVKGFDYVMFNSSYGSSKKKHTAIFVHESLL